MVIDLTIEDSEEESAERKAKTPRLLSNANDDDEEDFKHENLLSAFLSSDKKNASDGKIQVVIPSSRAVSERAVSEVETTSSVNKSSVSKGTPSSIHNGLSEFYKVDDVEERVKKASYAKSKDVKQSHLPFARSHRPVTFKASSDPRRLQNNPIYDIYIKQLKALNGPPIELDIGSRKLSIDSNFQFLNEYKLQEGVLLGNHDFSVGCTCGEVCKYETCDCIPSEEIDGFSKPITQYIQGPKGLRVLDPSFLKRTEIIYECSYRCGCPGSCFNRVVQHGRTIKLQIFDTPGHTRGFGLRSPEPIYAGQFIDCYLGEVVTEKEADVREDAAAAKGGHEASYLFSLDFFDNADGMNVVDGKKFGGVTRFMNHSCKPNCSLFPATQNHSDLYNYDLAFFARHDIPPMTELTFDYNPLWVESKEVDPDAVKCLCGEANCRGQLWPNNRKSNKPKPKKRKTTR